MTLPKPYVTPRGFLSGASARDAISSNRAVAFGNTQAFTAVELTDSTLSPQFHQTFLIADAPAAARPWLDSFAHAPDTFAGLSLAQPLLMGVVNVTPDSFSDGGRFAREDAAIAHGKALLEAGAAIVDVGGESTRPGAAPVPLAEEIARVVPVVRALASVGACVSIDTRHAAVMEAAIAAGARIVNDVTALTGEGAVAVVAGAKVPVLLMHMQGEPQTMQADPKYVWAPGDVFDYLEGRIQACLSAGLARDLIGIDPGIGFGKNDLHNAQILDHLPLYRALGVPVVLGVSRKSFIGRMSQGEDAQQRLAGSLAAAVLGTQAGAQIVRVHDVAETRQALAIARRIELGA